MSNMSSGSSPDGFLAEEPEREQEETTRDAGCQVLPGSREAGSQAGVDTVEGGTQTGDDDKEEDALASVAGQSKPQQCKAEEYTNDAYAEDLRMLADCQQEAGAAFQVAATAMREHIAERQCGQRLWLQQQRPPQQQQQQQQQQRLQDQPLRKGRRK